jgi:hypothetical protein
MGLQLHFTGLGDAFSMFLWFPASDLIWPLGCHALEREKNTRAKSRDADPRTTANDSVFCL